RSSATGAWSARLRSTASSSATSSRSISTSSPRTCSARSGSRAKRARSAFARIASQQPAIRSRSPLPSPRNGSTGRVIEGSPRASRPASYRAVGETCTACKLRSLIRHKRFARAPCRAPRVSPPPSGSRRIGGKPQEVRMRSRLVLAFALTLWLAPHRGPGEGAQGDPSIPPYQVVSGVAGNLNSIGSDTLNNLMTLWAEGFRAKYPNVRIQIEGKGSSTAPPALIDGTAQLGPISPEMKSTELDAFEKKYGYKPTP